MSTSQLSPGTVVDGRFTVGAAVRTRAGTTTYEATDAAGAAVSLTIYDGACFASGLALERSLRELRQLQSVVSPRILRVIAAGKHGDGIFEVTEPSPPESLGEHLGRGPLSLPEAAALIVQVGEALLEAQRVGVIHRNLGADVVFPSPEGTRVTGFAVGEPQPRGAGPLQTIAPEQVQGKVVDQRTLIYNVAALMQWMLAGVPLFSGDAETVLQAHEQQVPSEDIDGKLRRALGKDPRMRPMMLKQFLHDIATMGGVEPPKLAARVSAPAVSAPRAPIAAPKAAKPDAESRPSSRGWTMFMKAQDDDAATEPTSTPAPEAPSKPSTRGWTMFMQAQEGEEGAAKDEAAAEPEPEAPSAKPSTRGWTMFMQAQPDESQGSEAASESETPSPSAEPIAPEPDAPDPSKPSTRGWTMFTKSEEVDGDGEAESTEEKSADPKKPSTRGWTMFMADEEGGADADAADPKPEPPPESGPEAAAPTAAEAAPPADAPAAATTDTGSGPSASPSSRGWTMFMEPGAKEASAAAGAASAEQQPAPDPAPAPEAAEAELPKGKKRGWTMFMDAPIADLKAPSAEAAAEPADPPAPAVDGSSDKAGWTVFGTPAPGSQAGASGPAPEPPEVAAGTGGSPEEGELVVKGKTVQVTDPPAAPPFAASPPAGTADPALASASTVVNTGAPAGPAPVVRGKTIVAGAAGAEPGQPDTMYFKKGQVEPEGGVAARAPTARDIHSPARPAEERDGRPLGPSAIPPAVREPAELERPGSNVALYVVAAVVGVGALVAGYFAFM